MLDDFLFPKLKLCDPILVWYKSVFNICVDWVHHFYLLSGKMLLPCNLLAESSVVAINCKFHFINVLSESQNLFVQISLRLDKLLLEYVFKLIQLVPKHLHFSIWPHDQIFKIKNFCLQSVDFRIKTFHSPLQLFDLSLILSIKICKFIINIPQCLFELWANVINRSKLINILDQTFQLFSITPCGKP